MCVCVCVCVCVCTCVCVWESERECLYPCVHVFKRAARYCARACVCVCRSSSERKRLRKKARQHFSICYPCMKDLQINRSV